MASSSGTVTHSRGIGVLGNPSYAGTCVFGHYQSCKKIGPTGNLYAVAPPKISGALLFLTIILTILVRSVPREITRLDTRADPNP
jgi:hypothetical protein